MRRQKSEVAVELCQDEFTEKIKGPECALSVFESAELDYPSKEKKGGTSRCRRRIVKKSKKKNEVTEMSSLRRGRSLVKS